MNKPIKRAFLDTEDGQILYRIGGEGNPLVLLHQNYNSSNEFRELISILGREKLVIAMDFLGFGESDKPPRMYSIEDYAKTVILLLDRLGIEKTSILGSHFGAIVAGEVAAANPDRVDQVILSNIDYFDEQQRANQLNSVSNIFQLKEDAEHIKKRWLLRLEYLGCSLELNHRCFLDELKCYGYPAYAPFAVVNYMEKATERFSLISCPTLILSGTEDIKLLVQLGLATEKNRQLIAKSIPHAQVLDIAGGTIYMMNQMPEEISKIVREFLENPTKNSQVMF